MPPGRPPAERASSKSWVHRPAELASSARIRHGPRGVRGRERAAPARARRCRGRAKGHPPRLGLGGSEDALLSCARLGRARPSVPAGLSADMPSPSQRRAETKRKWLYLGAQREDASGTSRVFDLPRRIKISSYLIPCEIILTRIGVTYYNMLYYAMITIP